MFDSFEEKASLAKKSISESISNIHDVLKEGVNVVKNGDARTRWKQREMERDWATKAERKLTDTTNYVLGKKYYVVELISQMNGHEYYRFYLAKRKEDGHLFTQIGHEKHPPKKHNRIAGEIHNG